jgi:hypothetical protein
MTTRPYLSSDAPLLSSDVDSARHRAAVARIEHELATLDRRLARLHDRRALAAAWVFAALAACSIVFVFGAADPRMRFAGIFGSSVFAAAAIALLAMTPRLRRDYRAVHAYLRRERLRFASMLADLRSESARHDSTQL